MKPSIDELRVVCQPPELLSRSSEEHWAGRLYMRRLSIYVTWLAIRLGLSPNSLTAAMIVVGLLAGVVLATVAGVGGALTAALLIQTYLLLDCSDGEVARWTSRTSVKGVYLDRLGHYLVEGGLLIGLGIAASDESGESWLALGLAGAIGVIMTKVVADLVAASRARSGLAPSRESALTERRSLPRRISGVVPVHRAVGAVELSLLVVVAAVLDSLGATMRYTTLLLISLVAIAWAGFVIRTVVILRSSRLDQ